MQSKQINNKERVCRGNNTALVTVKMTFTLQHEHISAPTSKRKLHNIIRLSLDDERSVLNSIISVICPKIEGFSFSN